MDLISGLTTNFYLRGPSAQNTPSDNKYSMRTVLHRYLRTKAPADKVKFLTIGIFLILPVFDPISETPNEMKVAIAFKNSIS